MSRNVLVIEDQHDIANLIRLHLQDLPCSIKLAYNGQAGLAETRARKYDLVILDLMLPGIDGLEVCRQIRNQPAYTPILMVTAKAAEFDRVLGLEMGADDYLTKPFSLLELKARVKALFRRMDGLAANKGAGAEPIRVRELFIDPARRETSLRGKSVSLTAKEFDLLVHFARNPGRVYTRLQLLDLVWGHGHGGYEHNVNCHINRLRAKIESDHAHPRYVLTVRGVGYKFAENVAQEAA